MGWSTPLGSREKPVCLLEPALEHGRHVLEGHAHQQLGKKPIALLDEQEFVVEVQGATRREKRLSLEPDESRRDQQEPRGHLQIEILHLVDE